MRDFIIRESDLATLPKKRQEVARKVMKVLENIQNEMDYQYIRSPGDIFQLSTELIFEEIEKMLVFYLNTKNRVIKKEIISIGTLNASLVHPREVFKSAILNRSASIICVHNHPSGLPLNIVS